MRAKSPPNGMNFRHGNEGHHSGTHFWCGAKRLIWSESGNWTTTQNAESAADRVICDKPGQCVMKTGRNTRETLEELLIETLESRI
jgi:hypothetical protein